MTDFDDISAPYIEEQLEKYKKQKEAEIKAALQEGLWFSQYGYYQPGLFNVDEDGNIEPN